MEFDLDTIEYMVRRELKLINIHNKNYVEDEYLIEDLSNFICDYGVEFIDNPKTFIRDKLEYSKTPIEQFEDEDYYIRRDYNTYIIYEEL